MHFDTTINLGTVLAAAMVVGALMKAHASIMVRIVAIETELNFFRSWFNRTMFHESPDT